MNLKICKFIIPDEKIKILVKFRGDIRTTAVGVTFRSYFILKSNFLLIF